MIWLSIVRQLLIRKFVIYFCESHDEEAEEVWMIKKYTASGALS
jgi:hypothetical protein